MPDTAIAVEGRLDAVAGVAETEPTEIVTSVTHDAPWFPHDLT